MTTHGTHAWQQQTQPPAALPPPVGWVLQQCLQCTCALLPKFQPLQCTRQLHILLCFPCTVWLLPPWLLLPSASWCLSGQVVPEGWLPTGQSVSSSSHRDSSCSQRAIVLLPFSLPCQPTGLGLAGVTGVLPSHGAQLCRLPQRAACMCPLSWPPPLPAQAQPLHLWDGQSGTLRCTYRAYDAADEVTAALSLGFNPAGTSIWAGFNKNIRIFDLSRPGRECTSIVTHSKTQEGLPGQQAPRAEALHVASTCQGRSGRHVQYANLVTWVLQGP